jgi:hypothetical protein
LLDLKKLIYHPQQEATDQVARRQLHPDSLYQGQQPIRNLIETAQQHSSAHTQLGQLLLEAQTVADELEQLFAAVSIPRIGLFLRRYGLKRASRGRVFASGPAACAA